MRLKMNNMQVFGSTENSLALDNEKTVSEILQFIRRVYRSSSASGVLVGLSGGIDSSVVASLCVRALGENEVTGLLLFEKKNASGPDASDARELSYKLGIRTLEFELDNVLEVFLSSFPLKSNNRLWIGNLKARLRMTSLYFLANSENLLVAGTGDKSEDLIGYFTKYGDGGVDFLPIAHLYKSQVRDLGRFLGVSDGIVTKPSSPNLWDGQVATDEIPLDYDTLDRVLSCLFDQKLGPEETARAIGVDLGKVSEVVRRVETSAHKRSYPPMAREW